MLWASERFSQFEFSVGDSLLVHSYLALGHPVHGVVSEAAAHAFALAEGDEWLSLNRASIESILGPTEPEIYRWDTWLRQQGVQARLEVLGNLLEYNTQFRHAIESYASAFLGRRGLSREDLQPNALEHLDMYVLEELAVYQWQSEAHHAVNIYPGSDLATYQPLLDVKELPAPLRDRDYVVLALD